MGDTQRSRKVAGDAPSVSIVIPVHQHSAAFTRCLEAIQRLDPQPAEVLVVVDGGDRSLAPMAAAAGARPVLQHPQAGPATARNTGAAQATGDILLFLDSDVVVPTDIIATVTKALSEHPDVAAVIGSYEDRSPARNLASRYKNLLQHYVHQHARDEGCTFWGACGAIRRDVFLRLGGFDEDYLHPSIEDIELGYRLRSAGERVRVQKDLQVTHLKRWDARSLLKNDMLHRALPWSALILRTKRLYNDLNIALWERVKAVLAMLAAIALVTAAWWPRTALLAAGALLAILALNGRFLAFLARRGGAPLAIWGAGWHTLYHLYSAVGFAAAAIRHLVFGAQPARHPWPGSPRRRPARPRDPRVARFPGEPNAPRSPAPRHAGAPGHVTVQTPCPSPAISVVVPAHGRAHQLQACLSALADVEPPPGGFEVVVVDDGSPEPLDAVVANLSEKLPLTFCRQRNAGPAAARNAGARLAAAPLLAFTDDDCMASSSWLRSIADAAARHPDALLGGVTVNGLPENPFAEASQLLVDHLRAADGGQPRFFTSNNLAVPADHFRALGGFDSDFSRAAGEDRDLCDRWAASGRPLRQALDAVVVHQHNLGLRSFWHQHHNYGQGAYVFHRNRAKRANHRLKVAPPSFYATLLACPFRRSNRRRATLVGLLALTQVANAAGFAGEWLKIRPPDRRQLPVTDRLVIRQLH
jgi:GT2 family glycosyltransferase